MWPLERHMTRETSSQTNRGIIIKHHILVDSYHFRYIRFPVYPLYRPYTGSSPSGTHRTPISNLVILTGVVIALSHKLWVMKIPKNHLKSEQIEKKVGSSKKQIFQ